MKPVTHTPRTMQELRAAAWELAGSRFEHLSAEQAREVENLVREAYRRGRLDAQNPGSLDGGGIDRQTYEPPNCHSNRPHDQHFHSPIGGLTLNCPGKAVSS